MSSSDSDFEDLTDGVPKRVRSQKVISSQRTRSPPQGEKSPGLRTCSSQLSFAVETHKKCAKTASGRRISSASKHRRTKSTGSSKLTLDLSKKSSSSHSPESGHSPRKFGNAVSSPRKRKSLILRLREYAKKRTSPSASPTLSPSTSGESSRARSQTDEQVQFPVKESPKSSHSRKGAWRFSLDARKRSSDSKSEGSKPKEPSEQESFSKRISHKFKRFSKKVGRSSTKHFRREKSFGNMMNIIRVSSSESKHRMTRLPSHMRPIEDSERAASVRSIPHPVIYSPPPTKPKHTRRLSLDMDLIMGRPGLASSHPVVRSQSFHQETVDARIAHAKQQADEKLKKYLREISNSHKQYHIELRSEKLEKLKSLAITMLFTPVSEIRGGWSQNMVREIQSFAVPQESLARKKSTKPKKDVVAELEREFVAKLLFIVSEVARMEAFVNCLEFLEPSKDKKGGVDVLLDVRHQVKKEEESQLLGTTNLNLSEALQPEEQVTLVCRICEEDIPLGVFKTHSRLCVVRNKYELQNLSTDQSLKQLYREIQKVEKNLRKESKKQASLLRKVAAICKGAIKVPSDRSSYCFQLLKKLDESVVVKLGEDNPLDLLNFSLKLRDLIMEKQEAFQTIEKFMSIDLIHSPRKRGKQYMPSIPSIHDFEIIKPVARGGYANVFLARKKRTGDIYALKVLNKTDMIDRDQVENVLAERNILADSSCPYVVNLYYAFQTQRHLYLAMEYLPGGDVFSLLDAVGVFELDMARKYIYEVIIALDYLHGMGTVHRDIKPDNMLIDVDGHIKLADFGLSRVGLLHKQARSTQPTMQRRSMLQVNALRKLHRSSKLQDRVNALIELRNKRQQEEQEDQDSSRCIGTPDYLAPEVLVGSSHGPAVDWWAVGVVTFEFLTGVPPFNNGASSPQDIFNNIMANRIPWEDVQEFLFPEVIAFISDLLNHQPDQRLGSNGLKDFITHPFFNCQGETWDSIAAAPPPFIPKIPSLTDTSYFEGREQFFPINDDAQSDVSRKDDRAILEDEEFGTFWYVNGPNLEERNLEVYKKYMEETKSATQ